MFQTVLHSRVCVGEGDLHHRFPIQIAVRIFNLPDEITQPILPRCIRVEPDAAALNEHASVNILRVNRFHCLNAHHKLNTSLA